MDRRTAGFVLVAVVTLAGCNGAVGLSDDDPSQFEETVTPAPVPTATDTPIEPPWIESGQLDVDRLERAHRRALAARSYTLVGRPARDNTRAVNRTIAVESDSTYLLVTGNETIYTDPSGTVTRRHRSLDGTATVTTRPPVTLNRVQRSYIPFVYFPENVTRIDAVEHDRLSDVPFVSFPRNVSRIGAVERRGQLYYRLSLVTRWQSVDPTVTSYTATIYVTPEGFVQTAVFTARRERWGDDVRIGYRWTYRDVGTTTVEAPGWVERARQNETASGSLRVHE